MFSDVTFNCFDERFDAVERSSANSLVGYLPKPSFYQIKPGAGGRCEMHMEVMVAFQPALHFRVLVRRVIVHDEVKIQFGRGFLVDRLQKLNPFLMSVSRHAGSNQPSLG